MITEFQSERGFKLVTQEAKCKMLTVEDYMKWYDLYLINECSQVLPVMKNFDVDKIAEILDDNWFSHYITPLGFISIAKELGAHVDEKSYKAVVDRFIEDHYCLDANGNNEECIDKKYMPSDELKSEIIIL